MKLIPKGSNQTELHIDGVQILFSYETPVACWINGEYFMTSKFWSNATSRHINRWTNLATTRPQSFFDELVQGGSI